LLVFVTAIWSSQFLFGPFNYSELYGTWTGHSILKGKDRWTIGWCGDGLKKFEGVCRTLEWQSVLLVLSWFYVFEGSTKSGRESRIPRAAFAETGYWGPRAVFGIDWLRNWKGILMNRNSFIDRLWWKVVDRNWK
jgi:hypothetical protein